MKYKNSQRGFIALMSTVVISAILIAMMMSVGSASFYARYDALGIENSRQAEALAQSCINIALLALATSTDALHYSVVNQRVTVGVDTRGNPTICTIKNITHNGFRVTIDVFAESHNSFSAVSAIASLFPSIQIVSWEKK